MAEIWVAPEGLFDQGQLRHGQALCLRDGRVARIAPTASLPAAAEIRAVPGVVTPGFVDLQVNGGGGVLFNTSPDPAGIARIIAAHRQTGTVALMPTVITDAPAVLVAAAQAVIAARALPGCLGLHIEGPHLAQARRGTHAAAHLRPLDDLTWRVLRDLRRAAVPVMITLAPETLPDGAIRAMADLGVIVALGHSDATAAQAEAAFAAGAWAVTHLFNAMSQMQGRAPGLAGAAINSSAFVGVICDGVHVADPMIALACRARPVAGRMMLVSDAMPTVGGPDTFQLYGQTITRDGAVLRNAEGQLAGAHATMLSGLQRLVHHVGLSREQALQMAITAPATLLGQPQLQAVQGRALQDLFVLDHACALQPLSGSGGVAIA